MKTTLAISLLSLSLIGNTAFAALKVVPDKPVAPEFICKTESDIIIARTIAITRGGGPDFAGSSEVLCRSQIDTNKTQTNIIYQSSPVAYRENTEEKLRLVRESACKDVLLGGNLNSDNKCVCPEGKSATSMPNQKEVFICLSSNNVSTSTTASGYDSDRLKLALSAMVDDFLKEKPEYSKIINRDLIVQLVSANPDKYNDYNMGQIVNLVYGSNTVATTTVTISALKLSKSLKIGSRDPEVKILQSMLGVDQSGIFGPKTRQAVISFQKLNNLPASGFVGELTRKMLNK
jgi:murein L,D-transpeptidase YcbB/YkuD